MGWPKHADSADKVREWHSDKGRGGGQKSEQFCGRNKWKPPNGKNSLIISFLRSAARAPALLTDDPDRDDRKLRATRHYSSMGQILNMWSPHDAAGRGQPGARSWVSWSVNLSMMGEEILQRQ